MDAVPTLSVERRVASSDDVRERLYYVDGLRGIAILAVVLCSAFGVAPAAFAGAPPIVRAVLGHLNPAVDLFFLISGLCLAYPVLLVHRTDGLVRFDLARYVVRRIVRIVPSYYAAIAALLGIGVVGARLGWSLHGPLGSSPAVGDVVRQMLFLDGGTSFVNPQFWTLPVEVRWYAVVPIALIVWVRAPRAFGLLVAATVLAAAFTRSTSLDLVLLPAFLLGIVAADLRIRPIRLQQLAVALTLGAGLGLAVVTVTNLSTLVEPLWQFMLFFAIVAVGTFPAVERFFASRVLGFVGGASYAIFLVHQPVLAAVDGALARPLGAPAALALAVVASLAAGVAFWALVDLPFASAAKRRAAAAVGAGFAANALKSVEIPVAIEISGVEDAAAVALALRPMLVPVATLPSAPRELDDDHIATTATFELAERRAQAEAERKAAEQRARAEAERKAAEQRARAEAERKAAEQRAQAEAERKAAEQRAQAEAERKAAEQRAQAEAERNAAEQRAQAEAERKAAEQRAQAEAERKAAEQRAQAEAERKAAEQRAQAEAERKAAEQRAQAEAERKAAEQRARGEAERKAAEQRAQAEAERKAAEQRAREEAERKAAEQRAQAEAERKAAEQRAREEAERKAAEQRAQAEADRRLADRRAREAAEQLAVQQRERAEAERLAAERRTYEEAQRQAAERRARAEAEREIVAQQAREEAIREATERHAREEVERKALEQRGREEAERKIAEERAREEAAQVAAQQHASKQAARQVAERQARDQAERQAAEALVRQRAEMEEARKRVAAEWQEAQDRAAALKAAAAAQEAARARDSFTRQRRGQRFPLFGFRRQPEPESVPLDSVSVADRISRDFGNVVAGEQSLEPARLTETEETPAG